MSFSQAETTHVQVPWSYDMPLAEEKEAKEVHLSLHLNLILVCHFLEHN